MMEKCKTCMNGYPSVSCTNCGSGFRNYSPYSKPTNADRIRAMSDEDLARFLIEVENRRSCCGGGAKWNGLAHARNWLTQPAKEED